MIIIRENDTSSITMAKPRLSLTISLR